MLERIFFLNVLLLCANVFFAQQTITIDNTKPHLTDDGKIVDAHDGRIIKFGKKYYWYGTSYGATNGFTKANKYVCYSSTDLTRWHYENKLLTNEPEGVYYRPHVIYNERSKKYVLWYNWYPKLWDGQFGVATSDSPIGPFTVLNSNVTVKQQALGVGDLSLFVDDDAKAYISYCTIQNHKVSVELLNETYTESTQQGSEFIAEHCEAGSMFKRNGIYYLLTDYTCCFCTQGSGAQVFVASKPLGLYKYQQNINRYVGEPQAQLTDGKERNNNFTTLTAKAKDALTIELNKTSYVNKFSISQFTGNRNGQCGEVDNPILHDAIKTFAFEVKVYSNGNWETVNTKPTAAHSSMQIKYDFVINKNEVDAIAVTPLYADTIAPLQIDEINVNAPATVYKSAWGKPIIPAQQTHVMPLQTTTGVQYIWMGDMWGSASNNIKGQDYQYWSKPLAFYKNGMIKNLSWTNQFSIKLK